MLQLKKDYHYLDLRGKIWHSYIVGGWYMEITTFTIDLVGVAGFAGYALVIFGLTFLFPPKILLKLNNYANSFFINFLKVEANG